MPCIQNQSIMPCEAFAPGRLKPKNGPVTKPNAPIRAILNQDNIFKRLTAKGKKCALLNAYPPRYFHGVESGKRLLSSIPHAVNSAGIPLFTHEDYNAGRALSADFTGEGWTQMLGFPDAPVLTPRAAGERLAALARTYDFSLFEYWASDYAGHKQDMPSAIRQLAVLDDVFSGLADAWDDSDGLILVTSDHGNLEDLSTRRHTAAHVPALLIGSPGARASFAQELHDLTGIAPAIWRAITGLT